MWLKYRMPRNINIFFTHPSVIFSQIIPGCQSASMTAISAVNIRPSAPISTAVTALDEERCETRYQIWQSIRNKKMIRSVGDFSFFFFWSLFFLMSHCVSKSNCCYLQIHLAGPRGPFNEKCSLITR